MKRINSVEYIGENRKCISCGDVKIWDYPNERKCPFGKRHKWRPIKTEELTLEENASIDRQIKYDRENRKHHGLIFHNGKVIDTFHRKEVKR